MHLFNLIKRLRFKFASSNCKFSAKKFNSELKFCNIAEPTFIQGLPEFASGIAQVSVHHLVRSWGSLPLQK